MTAVTWNPSDKAAGVTLSGGDLTASHAAASYEGVRATTSKSSGKVYFEVYVTGRTSPAGLLTSGGSLTAIIGSTTLGRGFYINGSGQGHKYYNSVTTQLFSGLSLPATICVAADLDADKVWFGVNGTWSGDPAAGTGEAFNNATQTYFPAWVSSTLDATSSGVGRFASGDFVYTVPSGFSAWDQSVSAAGSSSGVSTAAAFSDFGVGESAGVATAAAVGGNPVWSGAGTSTANAIALAVRSGVGSAVGRAAANGSYVNTTAINRLTTVAGVLIYKQTSYIDGGGTPSSGSAVTSLNDSDLNNASPYVAAANERIYGYIPGAPLADTLVIYSSSLNPGDQAAYPTFAEPGDSGLIGDASERLRIDFYGSDIPSGVSVDDPLHAKEYNRVAGNRLTRLEFKLTAPAHVAAFSISGHDSGNNINGLDVGTAIKEVQLLSTKTIYSWTYDDASNVASSDELIAVHTIEFESTADASSTVIEKGYAKLTDGGVATSTAIGGQTEQAVGESVGLSSAAAYTILEEVLVDGGVAADTVSFSRSLALHSDGVLSTTLFGKLTHTEESIGEATDNIEGENSITQSEESTGNATDTVIGIRRVTVVEISGGVGSNADASKAHVELTLASNGQATSVAVQHSVQSETLESSGFAEETLPVPFQGSFPVFWTNSVSTGAATWEGLPFNSFIEADGTVYAAGPSGIFAMGDDLDDIDTEVPSEVEWDLVDSGSAQMKRMRSVYVNARTRSPFTVRVANEQGIFEYQTETADAETVTNHRAAIGRGIVSRNARLSILHTKAYVAENAGVGMLESTRRI